VLKSLSTPAPVAGTERTSRASDAIAGKRAWLSLQKGRGSISIISSKSLALNRD
jgi:hypothetical protein